MSSFHYTIEKKIEDVKNELSRILAQELKKDYIKLAWEGYQLIIRIEKMGSSEIRLLLKEHSDSKVHISEVKRSIAMMHKPFTSEVEKMVEDILGKKLGCVRV